MTRKHGYIDFGLYKKAIDELIECNPGFKDNEILWLHHFGESLLHPDFGRCIAYASRSGIRTGLSVNPIMLKEAVIDELLAAEPYVIYASLDGHDDASFYKIRGLDTAYGISKERLMDFLQKKIRDRRKTIVVLSMIDFELNRESISLTRNYWESVRGIDLFLAKSFTTWDGSAEDVNAYSHYSPGLTAVKSEVQCTMPWERMTLTWDGSVLPCCFDFDGKYVLGNIREETLADVWNGDKMRLLREEFRSNRVTNSLCKNCERLYLPRDKWEM
jgi:radical SAM protein with 4Fe4S-binding SPASM domain